jgi:hypothetical protein
MRTFRTVLEQKIWERRQTFEEFVEFAEMFAREHREPGTLGVRHLQRLASGHGPKGRPLGPVKPATARLLEHILGLSVDELLRSPTQAVTGDADEASSAVPVAAVASARLRASLDWLDDHVGWASDTSRQRVASQVGNADPGDILDRHLRRARVGRSDLARAVADYYRARSDGCELYSASTDGNRIRTTILTRPDWLDLCCPLTPSGDRVMFAHIDRDWAAESDRAGGSFAVDRLAEAAVLDVRSRTFRSTVCWTLM